MHAVAPTMSSSPPDTGRRRRSPWQVVIGGSPVAGITPVCAPRLYCQTPGSPAHITTRARDGSRLNCRAGGIAHCRSSRFSSMMY